MNKTDFSKDELLNLKKIFANSGEYLYWIKTKDIADIILDSNKTVVTYSKNQFNNDYRVTVRFINCGICPECGAIFWFGRRNNHKSCEIEYIFKCHNCGFLISKLAYNNEFIDSKLSGAHLIVKDFNRLNIFN